MDETIKRKIILLILSLTIIFIIYNNMSKIEYKNEMKTTKIKIKNDSNISNELKKLNNEDKIILREFIGEQYSIYKKKNISKKLISTFKNSALFTLIYGIITNDKLEEILIDSLTIGSIRTLVAIYRNK